MTEPGLVAMAGQFNRTGILLLRSCAASIRLAASWLAVRPALGQTTLIVVVTMQRQKSTTVHRDNLTDYQHDVGLTTLPCSIAT